MEESEEQLIDRQPEAAPSLLALGTAWTRVGYGVLMLAILAFTLNMAVHPVVSVADGAKIPTGYRMYAGKGGGVAMLPTPLGMFSVFTLIFSPLAGFVWTLVDVVDRRKRFVWLLPMFVCPLVASLHALPLALYLFYGRETRGHSESVQ